MSDTVYLSDIPDNNRMGKLFLFKLDGKNSPTVVSSNVGTIDYERAEILLKPINITGTSKKVQDISIIEVSACPQSNDVIGLQDLYLQLDINNSTIDMIADNVSSGENTSGTLYTATSSYMVGDIARMTENEKENTTLLSSDTYVVGENTQIGSAANTIPVQQTQY